MRRVFSLILPAFLAASNPAARPKAASNAGRIREKTRRIGTSSLSFGDFAGIAYCACDAIVSPTALYSLPARRPWRGGKVGTMKFVMAGLGLAALVSASPLLAQPASRFTLSATGSFVDTKTTAVDETNGVDIKFKNGCGARLAGTFYVTPDLGVEAGVSYQRITGNLRVQGLSLIHISEPTRL